MKKEYVRRLIFWGIVWLIVLGCAIGGVYLYYNGYGESGKIRQKLIPIVNEFNSLDDIADLRQKNNIIVQAEIVSNKIVINWITSSSQSEFDFTYSKEDDMEVLINDYNTSDSMSGEIIARGMMDAIYHVNEGEGSIFTKYELNDFNKTTLRQGANIISSGSDIQVRLNINENIINNIENIDINETQVTYITTNELNNLLTSLNETNRFDINKETIRLLVLSKEDKYEIYAENTSTEVNNDLYNSVINVIELLNNDTYNLITTNNDELNKDVKNDDYEVIINAKVEEENEFNENSSLLEVIINKPTEPENPEVTE